VSHDAWKTDAELDAERLRKNSAPTGAEFIPPTGQQIATKEQIADFWVARGEWTEQQKDKFLTRHGELEARDPEEDKRERLAQTERMRTEIRPEIARSMSPEDIKQRYEDLGLAARAEEFEKNLKFQQASEDPEKVEALCLKEGVKVLELEDRRDRNAATTNHVEPASSSEQRDERSNDGKSRVEADARTGRDVELTEAQQARIDRQIEREFREASNEINRSRSGHGM
jgi:hypothetical protein